MDHVHKILDMEYHKEALLFLLYINDLPLYVEHIMSEVYADDTNIHFSSNSISAINIKLNEDMEKVQKWCTSNDMVINTMKSKSMILFDLIYCV
jgi:hypothetical protein